MTPATEKYVLCIDDSGSRELNRPPDVARGDGMDWFALGGVLVKGEDVQPILDAHTAFCDAQRLDYPLHSASIRGARRNFGWLRKPEKSGYFWHDLSGSRFNSPIGGRIVV